LECRCSSLNWRFERRCNVRVTQKLFCDVSRLGPLSGSSEPVECRHLGPYRLLGGQRGLAVQHDPAPLVEFFVGAVLSGVLMQASHNVSPLRRRQHALVALKNLVGFGHPLVVERIEPFPVVQEWRSRSISADDDAGAGLAASCLRRLAISRFGCCP
jgi:hypothetical protein